MVVSTLCIHLTENEVRRSVHDTSNSGDFISKTAIPEGADARDPTANSGLESKVNGRILGQESNQLVHVFTDQGLVSGYYVLTRGDGSPHHILRSSHSSAELYDTIDLAVVQDIIYRGCIGCRFTQRDISRLGEVADTDLIHEGENVR